MLHDIKVDVSGIMEMQCVYVKDLNIPNGVRFWLRNTGGYGYRESYRRRRIGDATAAEGAEVKVETEKKRS